MATYTGTSIVDYLKSVGKDSSYSARSQLASQQGITNYTGTAAQNTQLLSILNKPTPTSTTTQPYDITVLPNYDPTKPFSGLTPEQQTAFANSSSNYKRSPTSTTTQPYDITVLPNYDPTKPVTQMTAEQLKSAISSTQSQISSLTTQLEEARKSEEVNAGTGATFTPPATTADNLMASYTQSALETLEKNRIAVENAYQQQLDTIKQQQDAAQKKYDDLLTKQEDILTTDVKPLTEPFRADIEASERQRLQVEENYQANQTLTNELDTLLTQIQSDLLAEKNVTGLSSIRTPRIAAATEQATARVGVIEAVMAARNNQITVAENLIDRTVTAMTADRQDQLNYYNSLLSFYSEEKDFAGNQLIQLTSDEKEMINNQIGLLENDLAITQSNAENIKKAMTDPDTALAYAKANVTLNDTPEQINIKLAKQGYIDEINDDSKEMAKDGFTYLISGANIPDGATPMTKTYTDPTTGKTIEKTWYKKSPTLSVAEAKSLGVPYGTTEAGAYGITPTESTSNILSVAEAKALGVPYGTTREEAYGLSAVKSLSPTQIKSVTDFNTTIASWNEVLRLSEEVKDEIGPTKIAAYKGSMSNLIAQYKNPKLQVLKAEVEKAFQLYRKETTGAQASDKELQMLRPNLPSLSERPEVFFGKINQTIAGTSRAKDVLLDTLDKAGYDMGKLLEGTTETTTNNGTTSIEDDPFGIYGGTTQPTQSIPENPETNSGAQATSSPFSWLLKPIQWLKT